MVIGIGTISADGRVALSEDDQIKWHSDEDIKIFIEETKKAGVVVMGRKTFEQIRARGRKLPDRHKVIMTRSPEKYDSNYQNWDDVEFTSDSPHQIVDNLTERGFENIFIIGGQQIYTLFINEGLMHAFYLSIEPYFFGANSIELLANIPDRPISLTLDSHKQIDTDTLHLRYTIQYE